MQAARAYRELTTDLEGGAYGPPSPVSGLDLPELSRPQKLGPFKYEL